MKYAVFNDDSTLRTCLIGGVHKISASAIRIDDDLFLRITQDTDGIWCLDDGKVIKKALQPVVPDYARLVAVERYKHEATGVSVGGLQIETTRDSQALIASTGLSAVLDPEYRCNFKTVTGFVEIGAVQIIDIAKAVRAHVQACFDRELTLLRAIETGEYHDEMLTDGWPDSLSPDTADLK